MYTFKSYESFKSMIEYRFNAYGHTVEQIASAFQVPVECIESILNENDSQQVNGKLKVRATNTTLNIRELI